MYLGLPEETDLQKQVRELKESEEYKYLLSIIPKERTTYTRNKVQELKKCVCVLNLFLRYDKTKMICIIVETLLTNGAEC